MAYFLNNKILKQIFMNFLSKHNKLITMLLVFLSIAFVACNNNDDDQDNNPNPNPTNNGVASCDITYNGVDYAIDGFGSFAVYDTSFVITADSGIDTLDYTSAVISIVEELGTVSTRIFGAFILNYTGPGNYTLYDYEEPEEGGLFWLWYSSNVSAGQNDIEGFGALYSGFGEEINGQVTITKDNANVVEGSFTIDDARGVVGGIDTQGIMQGSFSVEK
jgi:hypothetical protein